MTSSIYNNKLFKNGEPKVSIVIPVYNGSNYIEGAINSALSQTYKNIEIIVVNDGSNDDGATEDICKLYGKKIIYVSQKNKGVGGAMNTAFKHLSGDLFCWLSHDDEYLESKVEKQVKFLRSLDRDDLVVFGNYFLMNDENEVWHESQFDKDLLRNAPGIALLRGFVNGCTIMAPTHLIRKHLPFREDLKFTQDYDMWERIREDGEFIFMPETLVRYRIHDEQDTKSKDPNPECEVLWKWMMSKRSDTEKVLLNGSIKRYFTELAKFLDNTPYEEAAEYAHSKAKIAEFNSLVSIIIPFYNDIPKVLAAIESALKQTYPNIEIIIVNDGSTEDIKDVNNLISEYSNVILINTKNKGAANARNVGMNASKGEYIALLDGDDTFAHDKVYIQLSQMQDKGYLFSHTSYHVKYPERTETIGTIQSGEVNFKYPGIISSCSIATPTVMFHRVLLKMGLKFPTDAKLCEDVQTWIWVAARYPILGINLPLSTVNWRDNSGALNLEKGINGIGYLLKEIYKDPIYNKENQEYEKLNNLLTQLTKMYEFAKAHPLGVNTKYIVQLSTIEAAFPSIKKKSIRNNHKNYILEIKENDVSDHNKPYIIQVSPR